VIAKGSRRRIIASDERGQGLHEKKSTIVIVVCLLTACGTNELCLADTAAAVDTTYPEGVDRAVAGAEAAVEDADAAALEEALADAEDGGAKLALRTRIRQRSSSPDEVSLYRRLEWTLPSGSQLHIVADRDPGEPDWHDFVALYARWQMSDAVEAHVGDLRPGFAQGIVFSRGSGRGGTVSPSARRDSKSLGYRATGENQALRGASVRLRHRDFSATLITGQLQRDARLNGAGRVISLPEGGIHVSETERGGKDQLSAAVVGLRLHHNRDLLQYGLTVQHLTASSHGIDLRRPESRPNAFFGDDQRMMGIDASLRGRRGASAFAEVAVDGRKEWASVAGGRITLNGMRFDGQGRYYSPGFHSFFGGSASAVGMHNELGLAVSVSGRRCRMVRWRLFTDRYMRPWRSVTATVPVASSTSGGVLQSRISPRWRLESSLQRRRRLRASGLPHDRRLAVRIDAIGEGPRQAATLRLRGEWRRVRIQSETPQRGVNVSVSWRQKRALSDYAVHLSRFATDSYDARIYEYERDFPGSVSIRPLYGNGWRAYVLVRRTWTERLTLALRCRHERDAAGQRRSTLTGLQVDYGH
jgi:hypothetical protein